MTLKDLLRLAFNAGREAEDGFDAWWDEDGAERHEEYLTEGAQRDIDGQAGDDDDA